MRQGGALLTLALTAGLLGGCVYDPYSGLFVPCCSYYYPYGYAYPPSYYTYGYPPPFYGSQAPGPPAGPAPQSTRTLAQRFAAANVTHDGRLTRDQAAAGMPVVAQNFDAIDFDRKSYVTLPEVRNFMAQFRMQGGPAGPYYGQ